MQNKILKTIYHPNEIKKIIQTNYNLNDIIVDIITIRIDNNYIYKIITKNKQYILKIFNINKSLKDLQFEIKYTLFLKNSNLLIPVPFKALNNKYFFYINFPEGKRLAILTDYIEGTTLTYTVNDIYLFGKNIAKLHNISSSFYINTNECKKYNILEIFKERKIIVNNFLKNYHDMHISFFVNFSNILLSEVKNIIFTQGYCHNDLHIDNTKKNSNGIYLFDFDFSGYGYIIYDLAVFKWSCMIRNNIDFWKIFLKGYKSVKKINSQELKYILFFVAMRDILVMSFYIDRIDIVGHKLVNKSYINSRMLFLKNIFRLIVKRVKYE